MPSPEQMNQMMNNPMVQSMLDNPDFMRNMMESNPQVRAMLDSNPQYVLHTIMNIVVFVVMIYDLLHRCVSNIPFFIE
jgi:uncharacterized membrane protein YkgB